MDKPVSNKLELHEAMAVVLLNMPRRAASPAAIAKEINARQLYQRKDKAALEGSQVSARAGKPEYSDWFEVSGGLIRLRDFEPDDSQTALSVVEKAIGGKLSNGMTTKKSR
jgi:hypothetical protein